jgi:uncharacterized protein YecT (DUF1311 family)
MTFDGRDEPPLTLARDEAPPAPAGPGRKALLGGVALACVVGIGLGVLARPQLAVDAPKPAAMQPSAKTAERQMDIVIGEPAPEPPVAKSTPLEVMSPELAQAAAATMPPAAPHPEPEVAETDPPAPEFAETRPEPVRLEQASFDCRRAETYAEEMVCSDPALAAADRHLARAYQRALRLGAPYDLLRAQQDDWLAVREEAARRSPRAVAALYDQRIEQLNAMVRGPGPDW